MLGLILKDLLANRRYLYTGGLLVIFYIYYGFFANNFYFINMIIILLSAMFVLTTFSYDDMAHWNAYALTMPTTRKHMVNAKYILTILIAFAGSVICFVINLIHGFIAKRPLSTDSFVLIGVCFLIAILFNCIEIPIVIKLGAEKARLAILAVVLLPTFFLILLEKSNIKMPSLAALSPIIPHVPIISIIGTVLLFFFSLKISHVIISKKEF